MARNEQIGTVPCPFPGCKVECRLFKYRPREDGRRSAFTGKWYAECSDHGRIDGASGKATQDFLLDKGTVWGAKKPDATEGAEPVKPATNPEPSTAPAATAAPPKEPEKSAPKPVPRPAPNPVQQQHKPKETGWGFFS